MFELLLIDDNLNGDLSNKIARIIDRLDRLPNGLPITRYMSSIKFSNKSKILIDITYYEHASKNIKMHIKDILAAETKAFYDVLSSGKEKTVVIILSPETKNAS